MARPQQQSTEPNTQESPRRRGRPRRASRNPVPLPAPTPTTEIDPLTQVLNNASIQGHGLTLTEQARQSGSPLTLALIDADDFSEINAALGPEHADRFLHAFAQRLNQLEFNPKPLCGRLAGDTFLLILQNIEAEEAFLKLETFRAQISEHTYKIGRGANFRKHDLTASIGLAGFPKDAPTFEETMARAAAALRRAKRLGKNRVALAPDDTMSTKTSHYSQSQLEALRQLSKRIDLGEASLLREALEDLFLKYKRRRPG